VAEQRSDITAAEVAKVARLARLDIDEATVDHFTVQLARVMDHFSDIDSLDLDGVEPMAHPVRIVNVLRADEPGAPLDRDEVLSQAPAAEDGQFRVPPVLGEAP